MGLPNVTVGVVAAIIFKNLGVANEDITVHEVPLVEVVAWLAAKAKSGVLIDPKIYAGLFFVIQK